ncbi:MAG: glycosyltransferase family 2 protein [Blastocatellia bacterium]|nr:glycosyltransferase family 2 protein [Blastocatellia bacterium]
MGTDPLTLFFAACGIALALAALPGTLELALLTFGSLIPRRRKSPAEAAQSLRLAVVVPAHNEAGGIARCVRSLLDCEQQDGGSFTVFVVADNCTDETAARAAAAGARVLVRRNLTERGKGYALDFAFQTVLAENFDAALIVDADTVVEPNFLAVFRRLFAEGADAAQCGYLVNNSDASLRTRLMNVALCAFNVLRPRSRDRWGLSTGLLGNGFGLSAATLRAIPYDAVSVVEDLEYHLRLVRAGRRVRFAEGTTVRADMPTGGRGAETQRARWEGGRFRMLAEIGPALLRDLARGRARMLEPLIDLLLLPLAFHVTLLLATLVIPFAPTRIFAAAGLGLVVLHILAALLVGGGGWKDLAALAAAPFYVAWKVMLIPAVLRTARQNAEWVRTEREQQPEESSKPKGLEARG